MFKAGDNPFVVMRTDGSSVPEWRPSGKQMDWSKLVEDSRAVKSAIPVECRLADTFAKKSLGSRSGALAAVARAGRILFRTLLPDPDDREFFKMILGETTGGLVRVPGFAASVPWEALFLGDDPESAGPDGFLGWTHKFHRASGDDSRLYFLHPRPQALIPPMGLIEDDGLSSVISGYNRASLPLLSEASSIMPGLSHRAEIKTLEEFLYNGSSAVFGAATSGVFHFDCHMQRKDEAPAIRHSHINVRSTVPIDFDRFADMRIANGAFVFFNVCEGGSTAFDDETTYAGTLVTNGADSVVAVEAEIGDEFASDFARRFYERTIRGRSVGDAVFETRREILAESLNPSALFFSVYGLENYQLVHPANLDTPLPGKAFA